MPAPPREGPPMSDSTPAREPPAVDGEAVSDPGRAPGSDPGPPARLIPQPHGGALCPPWQKGVVANPAGSNLKQRFKAAVLRQLRRRMREGDEDELDVAASRLVELVMVKDRSATSLLLELWAREDGPVETRIAGRDGGAPLRVVMELRDTRTPRASDGACAPSVIARDPHD